MANNFTALYTVLNTLGTMIIGALYPNRVMRNAILNGRAVDNEFAVLGNTTSFMIEPELTAQRFKKGDTVNYQDMNPSFVDVTLDTILKVPLKIDQVDLTNVGDSFFEKYSKAGAKAIENEADRLIIEKAITSQYLTAQSSPVTLDDLLTVNQAMDDRNVPLDERYFVIDSALKKSVLKIDQFLAADKRGDNTAFKKAMVGDALGQMYLQSLNMYGKRTPADVTLAVNNGAGYPIGATSIAFDGGSGSDLSAGDVITFAGEAGTPNHVVKSVIFSTAGQAGTVVLSNALTGAIADDDVITVKKPNEAISLNPRAMVFGNKPLRAYPDKVSTSIVTEYGSILLTLGSDPETMDTMLYIDMLCGVEVMNEKLIQRFVDLS